MAFFGELYLRSTRPLLDAPRTLAEVEYLAACVGNVGRVLDLGCGHGRHAAALAARRVPVVGVERDERSLAEREGPFLAVRGDLRELPFAPGCFGGAFAWYSTLFIFEDAVNQSVLQGIHRVMKPGGVLVVHTVPYEHLVQSPGARFERTLPDGSRLEEESAFDPGTGRDTARRTLTEPGGRTLSATYFVRYYPRAQLVQLFESSGFSIRWLHGSARGEPLSDDSRELILGATRL